jgi:hypothetical protein
VPDNYLYARVALVVKDKGTLSEEKLGELTEVLGEEAKAQEVRGGAEGKGGLGKGAVVWGMGYGEEAKAQQLRVTSTA